MHLGSRWQMRAVVTASLSWGIATGSLGAEGGKAPENSGLSKQMSQIAAKKNRSRYCSKYQGKYLAYYGEIYLIERCKRRKLSSDRVYHLTKSGKRVIAVESEVIAAIPEGAPVSGGVYSGKARSCRRFNNQYVSSKSGSVYFVQNCRKREFSTWASYQAHRDKRRSGGGIKIHGLSEQELRSLRAGSPMPEPEADQTTKLGSENVDILPIGEACRGIEGRVVSYYSKIYRISRCKKRLIAPDVFSTRYPGTNPKELTSEQWISIPDGKPIEGSKKKG